MTWEPTPEQVDRGARAVSDLWKRRIVGDYVTTREEIEAAQKALAPEDTVPVFLTPDLARQRQCELAQIPFHAQRANDREELRALNTALDYLKGA